MGTALITSSLAVAVASPVTHLEHALTWPDPQLSYLFVILAVAIAPLAVAVGLAFDKVMSMARPKPQIRSWMLVPADRVRGVGHRHLLDLVAGASRERPQHPDGQHERRHDARRARRSSWS